MEMRNIATVVTTCPRVVDYLPGTLQSIRDAGFFGTIVSNDVAKVGNVANYHFALTRALRMVPRATHVLVLEDDVRLSAGLADWLENRMEFPEPEHGIGVMSLYCSSVDNQPENGWWRLPMAVTKEDQQPWFKTHGALAMLWSRASAGKFLNATPAFRGRSMVDALIGAWCYNAGLSLWTHYPSFVQHVGNASSFSCLPKESDAGVPLTPARMADSFVADVGSVY
jgi:hypothetical protein